MKIIFIVENLSSRLLVESILMDGLQDVEIKSVAKEKEFEKEFLRFVPDVIIGCGVSENFSMLHALQWLKEMNIHKPGLLIYDKINEEQKQVFQEYGIQDFIAKHQLANLPSLILKVYEQEKIKSEKAEAENLLKVSNERLETFFKHAPEAIINIGLNGKILEMNPAALEILNIKSFHKLRNKLIWDHIIKEDVKNFRKAHQAVSRGHHQSIQFRIDSGYRRIAWLESNMVPLRDEEGAVCSVLTISRDITIQKNVLEELSYQAALTNNIVDAVISVDKDFIIKSWNKGAEKLYGYTTEEAKGKIINELIKVEYENNNRDELIQELHKNGYLSGENTGHTKSGETKNVFFSISKLQTASGVSYVGIYRDITLQKKAIGELSYQAALTKNILDAVITTDNNFIIRSWNKGAEKLYGYTELEAKGKVINEFLKFHYEKGNRNEILAELKANGQVKGEFIGITKSGEARNVFFSLSNLETEHGVATVGLHRDITFQKKADLLLKENEEKFSKVFHESPAGIAISRLSDRKFIEVNNKVLELIECTREEIIGHTLTELNLGISIETHNKIVTQLKSVGFIKDVEQTILTKAGTQKHVLASAHVVFINGEAHTISIYHDITAQKKANEELNLHAIVNRNMFAAVFSTDETMVVKSWNQEAERLYGFSQEEAIGKCISDLLKFKHRFSTKEESQKELFQNGFASGEIIAIAKNGDEKHINYRVSQLLDESKKLIGFVALHLDVTEKKITERKLLEVENYMAASMQSLPAMIWSVDVQLNLKYFNQKMADTLKNVYHIELITGMNLDQFIPPDLFPALHDKHKTHYERALSGNSVSFEDTMEVNGEVQHLVISLYPVLENDQVTSITCISKDITEIKTVQELVIKSEEHFRTLSDHSPVGIYLTDNKCNIEYVNQRFYELTGITPMNNLTVAYYDSMQDCDIEKIKKEVSALQLSGQLSLQYQASFKKPDGKITFSLIQLKKLQKKSGMIYGYVGTITDITEKIEKENIILEKKRRLKFAQSLAHFGDWTFNPQTKYGEWSEELFKIYEFDIEKGVPDFCDFLTHVHIDDRENLQILSQKIFQDKTKGEFTFRFITSAGKEKIILTNMAFFAGKNSNPDMLAGTAQDITLLKFSDKKNTTAQSAKTS